MRDHVPEALWSDEQETQLREAVARGAGLPADYEVDPIELWGFRAEERLRDAAPAVVRIGGGWIGIVGGRGDSLELLGPDLRKRKVRLEQLRAAVCEGIEEKHRKEAEELGASIGVPQVVSVLLRERTRFESAGTLYKMRTPPGASFLRQCRQAGVARRAAILVAAHFAEYALWTASWWLLGRDALAGRFDTGWMAAWAMMLACIVPLRMWTTWSQGVLAVGLGGLLRQRLLVGALKLSPEEVRLEGAGRFLGRAIEAELVESLALAGGVGSILATVELAFAMAVLAAGAGGWLQSLTLAVWTAVSVWLGLRYWRARRDWTQQRLSLTHDAVEQMCGHRTRVAQQPSADWHTDEDRSLDEYAVKSRKLDRRAVLLTAMAPRGWLLLGLGGLVPALVGARLDAQGIAVSLGGILLGWRGLRRFASGLASLSGAAISWEQVASLFQAASRPSARGTLGSVERQTTAGGTVLEASGITFGYGAGRRVLNGVGLRVVRGEWILLEGESGGGKSTLASVLGGNRKAQGGLVTAGGLDRQTLGDTLWRRKVVVAPQYHENHVLTGPFAYNLLLGRGWPAMPEEMREADTICRELGLGPLLERMPGGLMQMVGETGWQLSQGERSRLFMARALLQQSEMVILDESLAALDPDSLRLALECALRRAKTLMVVAHP